MRRAVPIVALALAAGCGRSGFTVGGGSGAGLLTIDRVGNGRVFSTPPGIDCGPANADCQWRFTPGTQVTLLVTTGDGIALASWSGCAVGASSCIAATGSAETTVNVRFDHRLRVAVVGTGMVAGNGNLACPGTCEAWLHPNATAQLSATLGGGSVAVWSGCAPTGAGLTCEAPMSSPVSVVARLPRPGDPVWAKVTGGAGADVAYGLTIDAAGRYVVAGVEDGGTRAAFVRSHASGDGTPLWERLWDGTVDDEAHGIATEGDRVWVAGLTDSPTLPFDMTNSLTTAGGSDGFLVALASSGLGFVRLANSTPLTANDELFCSAGQNGVFAGGWNLDAGNDDGRTMRIDPANGTSDWLYVSDGAGDARVEGVAPFGAEAISAGWFNGAITILLVTFTSNADDVFISRVDATGAEDWTKNAGTGGNDRALAVATGPDAIYVAGYFDGDSGNLDFGNSQVAAQLGGDDVFVARLDPANGNAVWAISLGDAGGNERAFAIAVSGGKLAVAGRFDNAFETIGAVGGRDAFVAMLDTNGAVQWVRTFGTNGDEEAHAVVVEPTGWAGVAGLIGGDVDLDGDGIFEGFGGADDAFVMRLAP